MPTSCVNNSGDNFGDSGEKDCYFLFSIMPLMVGILLFITMYVPYSQWYNGKATDEVFPCKVMEVKIYKIYRDPISDARSYYLVGKINNTLTDEIHKFQYPCSIKDREECKEDIDLYFPLNTDLTCNKRIEPAIICLEDSQGVSTCDEPMVFIAPVDFKINPNGQFTVIWVFLIWGIICTICLWCPCCLTTEEINALSVDQNTNGPGNKRKK